MTSLTLDSRNDSDDNISNAPISSDTSSESNTPKRCYGWKPSTHDSRDLKLVDKIFFKSPGLINFPPSMELDDMPPIYTQGNLGSCTANAISSSYRYGKQRNDKKKSLKFSYQADYFYTTTNDY